MELEKLTNNKFNKNLKQEIVDQILDAVFMPILIFSLKWGQGEVKIREIKQKDHIFSIFSRKIYCGHFPALFMKYSASEIRSTYFYFKYLLS